MTNERRYTQAEMDENYKSGKVYYARQIKGILDSLRTDKEKLDEFAKWTDEEPGEAVDKLPEGARHRDENVSIGVDSFSGDFIH